MPLSIGVGIVVCDVIGLRACGDNPKQGVKKCHMVQCQRQ
jgi:hypothetical protein